MQDAHDPDWYREEARRLRSVGERYVADDSLRQGYLAVANEYDRFAEVLEKGQEPYPAASDQSYTER